MPKEPSLPAVHLAGVERARYVVATEEAAARNGREIAARKTPSAAPRGPEPVSPVRPKTVRAHELKKGKKAPRKKEVEPPPPDPRGRGRSLDIQA